MLEKPKEFIKTYNLLLELANNKYPILKSKLEEIIIGFMKMSYLKN